MPAKDGTGRTGPVLYDALPRNKIVSNLRRYLPPAVRRLKSFVVFKFAPPKKPGGKRNKLPFYVVGRKVRSGEHGSKQDKSNLVGFAEAVRLLETERAWAGIGACALQENPVFFIDLDNCVDLNTGELTPLAAELLRWKTYTEISPSGKGLRMVLGGNPGVNGKNHKAGIELFCSKGFVTLTGMPFGKVSHQVKQATTSQMRRLRELLELPAPSRETDEDPDAPVSIPSPLTKERYQDVKRAINHIDPDCSYDDWLLVGQALHSGDPRPSGKGFELWLRWSRKGDKFEQTNEEEMARKWSGFAAGRGYTLASLFALAQEGGFDAKHGTTEPLPDTTHIESYTPTSSPEVKTYPLAEGLFDNYGAYVFIGRAKIGKSRILGSIVAAALCGGDALGFKFLKECKVLALTLEEEPATLLERIRAYAVEPTEHDKQLHLIDERLALKAAKNHSDDHDWTAWLDLMLRQFKPDLVYVDTAIKMRMLWQNDPAYRTKNITEQDYQNASWLDQAAQRHKCVIVSVIHGSKRKNAPQHNFDPFESIGTTSWTLAGCTGALVLMDKPGHNPLEEEDDGQRVFSVRGRYMPHGDTHYVVQSNSSGTFSNLGEYHHVIASVRTQEYLRMVLEAQQQGADNVTARTIAALSGRSERTVHVLLRKFMESGQLFEGQRLEAKQGSGYRFVQPVASRKKAADDFRRPVDDIL